MTGRKRSGKLPGPVCLIGLLAAMFVLQSASFVRGQDFPLPHLITEPEPIWPDSIAYIEYDREARALNMDEIVRRVGYPQVKQDDEFPPSKVIVRVLVDKDGNYVRHYVIARTRNELMHAVEPLVPDIKWLPAQKDGSPVASWVTLPFTFCFPRR